jgi:ribosomal protein S18 acetylase RimI-like enzyme
VTSVYSIRKAVIDDVETIVGFTLQEAREAEGSDKDVEAVRRGVRAAFASPALAVYWVAETRDRRVAGSASVTTEWSNFHGGQYWWIQSLFIVPEHRGRGLVELLLDHLSSEAAQSGALELRLYVHTSNARALGAYARCGFTAAPYVIMTRQPARSIASRPE